MCIVALLYTVSYIAMCSRCTSPMVFFPLLYYYYFLLFTKNNNNYITCAHIRLRVIIEVQDVVVVFATYIHTAHDAPIYYNTL